MPESRNLKDIEPGYSVYVSELRMSGLLRRRLVDLGFVAGARVEVLPEASDKDPRIYTIKSTTLAIRNSDAEKIIVSDIAPAKDLSHYSLENRSQESDQPEKAEEITVALAGNPNAGKSTVFNALTGLNQHVGNWPGKTVSRAEGWWKYREKTFKLVDLPGTYSLLSTSLEEEVARDYILFGHPTCTVIVTDATRLERHLNLAIQILQITDRAILCVNMIDEAERDGIIIDRAKLEAKLGVPVVLTAANKKRGLQELQNAVWQIAVENQRTMPLMIPMPNRVSAPVEDLAQDLERAFPGLQNTRWIAMRLIEGGDERINYEVAQGLLVDEEGRTGSRSLTGASPTKREIKR